MIKKSEILPIGTIIELGNENHLYMIISRSMLVNYKEKQYYFDYGICMYPEGVFENNIAYINQEDIEKIIFKPEKFKGEDDFVQKVFEAQIIYEDKKMPEDVYKNMLEEFAKKVGKNG